MPVRRLDLMERTSLISSLKDWEMKPISPPLYEIMTGTE